MSVAFLALFIFDVNLPFRSGGVILFVDEQKAGAWRIDLFPRKARSAAWVTPWPKSKSGLWRKAGSKEQGCRQGLSSESELHPSNGRRRQRESSAADTAARAGDLAKAPGGSIWWRTEGDARESGCAMVIHACMACASRAPSHLVVASWRRGASRSTVRGPGSREQPRRVTSHPSTRCRAHAAPMDDVPASDELATLLACTEDDSDGLADHLAIIHSIAQDTRRRRATQAVQHRSWKTADIFRSEPRDPRTSSPVAMPFLASSPPPTPSPPTPQLRQKRRLEDLDLGTNQLARPPKAQRSYYGIDIHRLLQEAEAEDRVAKVVAAAAEPPSPPAEPAAPRSSLLWTEKYRARKFTDLIGDERTHRSVMHWLKRWDEIVFPGSCRPTKHRGKEHCEEKALRKVLLLTGPPGLGKTTLAHVCAKQAGYEVQEINASDERSSGVVKGRVRDMVGTENVRGVDTKTVDGKVRKAGKPVCVIIDEVDGVVTGSGGAGGEV